MYDPSADFTKAFVDDCRTDDAFYKALQERIRANDGDGVKRLITDRLEAVCQRANGWLETVFLRLAARQVSVDRAAADLGYAPEFSIPAAPGFFQKKVLAERAAAAKAGRP